MRRSCFLLSFCAIVLGAAVDAAAAQQITIDFDNLAVGTAVTNQYPPAVFSSSAGQYNVAGGSFDLGTSLPNYICTAAVGGGLNCTSPTYVDFCTPVKNLRFYQGGDNATGVGAQVRVFVNGTLAATVDVPTDDNFFVPNLVDLSAYQDVTRIEIVNITDPGGLAWDDFQFELGAPLPTPPNPLAVGPHGVGRLADFNDANVVVAAGTFPEIPDVVLQRDGSEGSSGWVATGQDLIAGFDMSGRIRYPAMGGGGLNAPVAAGGPFPLIVIAHGNHRRFADAAPPLGPGVAGVRDPRDENYRGYGYLQDLLATHGFISVSIDLDDFTRLFPGILARAWLVLCHIERMETLDTNSGVLMGHIDLSRIGLMGHSRGGDAAVQAQRMNDVIGGVNGGPAVGPGSGEGAWAIQAVWSIAATRFFDGTFNWDMVAPIQPVVPSSVLVGALPFLGMWGDADGDVNGDGGGVLLANHVEGIYDGSPPGPKQFVWIEGANHNFWNTSWFLGGLGGIFGDDGEGLVGTRITPGQQQNLAKGYGLAFFRAHIQGETALRDYFRFAANQLPPVPMAASRVHLQYQGAAADRVVVDDFESNDALGTTSAGQAGVDTSTLVNPDEIELTGASMYAPLAARSWYHNSRGLLFEWNAPTDYYESVLPAAQQDVSGLAVLSFRIAQDRRHAASGTEPVVCVELRDVNGMIASVSSDDVTSIPVHQARFDDARLTKSMLKTVRIPLCRFTEAEPALDLRNVEKIRFVFPSRATGQASIDDIEFSQ